MQAAV